MGDEDRVVVVEVAVPDAGAGHMRHRLVAGELDHVVVAGQPAVHRQRERLEQALPPEPREERGRRPPLVVAPLGAHVVEGGAVRDLDLGDRVQPRRRRPAFEQREIGARLEPDQVMHQRVRPRRAAAIDEADRPRRAPGHPDRHAFGRPRRVERGERPVDRLLPAPLEHAEELARPGDVGGQHLGERPDLHALHRGIVGQVGREDPVDEDEPQPVGAVEHRLLVVRQHRRRGRRLRGQAARVGELPVFVAPDRRAALGEPPRRAGPRGLRPAGLAGRLGPGPDQRLGAVELQCRDRHHATDFRMSA